MRILLLSAYDAQSHKYWREGMVAQFSEHQWTQLVLPGRHFSWRIRGNSMQWALGERDTLEQNYDLIIATSMVDLSSLKGMVPNLAPIPSILYFHENQFVYPPNQTNQKYHLGPKMVTLYGAIAANKLVFNSRYNQLSFMAGVSELLSKMPEKMPIDVAEMLAQKSVILPVALNQLTASNPSNDTVQSDEYYSKVWPKRAERDVPLRLVWAARWEYDKGPQQLLALLRELHKRKVNFQLCVLGQRFRKQPVEFDQIASEFAAYIVQFGYAESNHQYLSWLAGADMVLSTALHEFQGLAVLEAVQLGCTPILPNRLVYPELFSGDYLYESNPLDLEQEAASAATLIQTMAVKMRQGNKATASLQYLTWPVMKPKYENALNSTVPIKPSSQFSSKT
ncbi:MAG: DUF3524 domain-containing protein [Gammaproteobacteria bacterium]|nr:DUF3524 domain-containing protein [Gammaproteobacteria bacterium]